MAEYIVLFRLPLSPGSEIIKLLQQDGWRSVSDVVYFRSVNLDRDEVVSQIKNACRESRGLAGHRNTAFTVIPVKPGTINAIDPSASGHLNALKNVRV
jgi:predicted RNA binding protein YcfA (HicA-like mRNA interferase family)